jgi:hypothetical protein
MVPLVIAGSCCCVRASSRPVWASRHTTKSVVFWSGTCPGGMAVVTSTRRSRGPITARNSVVRWRAVHTVRKPLTVNSRATIPPGDESAV